MTKAEYLYGEGIEPKRWKFMDYLSVLQLKIRLADDRIRILNKVSMMERDDVNINNCLKAIAFNEGLIKELNIKG